MTGFGQQNVTAASTQQDGGDVVLEREHLEQTPLHFRLWSGRTVRPSELSATEVLELLVTVVYPGASY